MNTNLPSIRTKELHKGIQELRKKDILEESHTNKERKTLQRERHKNSSGNSERREEPEMFNMRHDILFSLVYILFDFLGRITWSGPQPLYPSSVGLKSHCFLVPVCLEVIKGLSSS